MKTASLIALVLLASTVATGRAETVVVVSASSPVTALSREDAVRIFMGRYRHFPHGGGAQPFDREADAPVRAEFYRRLLGKTLDEINAYWAHLRFSGRTQPPTEVDGRPAYLREIASDPAAIGYAENGKMPAGVRVVLVLPE